MEERSRRAILHLIGVPGGNRNWKRKNNHRENRDHGGWSIQAESWTAEAKQKDVSVRRQSILANINQPFPLWFPFLHLCNGDDQEVYLFRELVERCATGSVNSSFPLSPPLATHNRCQISHFYFIIEWNQNIVKGTKGENKKISLSRSI